MLANAVLASWLCDGELNIISLDMMGSNLDFIEEITNLTERRGSEFMITTNPNIRHCAMGTKLDKKASDL